MNSHQHPPLDYNTITDGIYIGTNQCCQTHFDETLLAKEGIGVDISLEYERTDQPFGVEFYLWIPIKNHAAPTQAQLAFIVYVLEKLVAMQKRIYVHCRNGHGRAPTLVAAYLMKTKGMSPEGAEAFIKSKRPTIHIEEVQREAIRKFLNPNI